MEGFSAGQRNGGAMAGLLAGVDLDCLQSFSCLKLRDPGCYDARASDAAVTCVQIATLELCDSSLGECNSTCPGWCNASLQATVRCGASVSSHVDYMPCLRLIQCPERAHRIGRVSVDVATVFGYSGAPTVQLSALSAAASSLLPGASATLVASSIWQLTRLRLRLFMNAAVSSAAAINGSLCQLADRLDAVATSLDAAAGSWQVKLMEANYTR
eukprot:SAG31_NODE_13251_length_882_cov_1.767561_1_plen_213_part_01